MFKELIESVVSALERPVTPARGQQVQRWSEKSLEQCWWPRWVSDSLLALQEGAESNPLFVVVFFLPCLYHSLIPPAGCSAPSDSHCHAAGQHTFCGGPGEEKKGESLKKQSHPCFNNHRFTSFLPKFSDILSCRDVTVNPEEFLKQKYWLSCYYCCWFGFANVYTGEVVVTLPPACAVRIWQQVKVLKVNTVWGTNLTDVCAGLLKAHMHTNASAQL